MAGSQGRARGRVRDGRGMPGSRGGSMGRSQRCRGPGEGAWATASGAGGGAWGCGGGVSPRVAQLSPHRQLPRADLPPAQAGCGGHRAGGREVRPPAPDTQGLHGTGMQGWAPGSCGGAAHRTTPMLYTSAFSVHRWPRSSSGADLQQGGRAPRSALSSRHRACSETHARLPALQPRPCGACPPAALAGMRTGSSRLASRRGGPTWHPAAPWGGALTGPACPPRTRPLSLWVRRL